MDRIFSTSFAACLGAMVLSVLGGCASAPVKAVRQESYSFWPVFPEAPRIQFLASYRFSADVRPPRSGFDELVFGKEQKVLPINMPYGVAMWNGRIYVCDIRNAAVLCLDLRGQQVRMLGTSGTVRFVSPTDIAITPDGVKYVTDIRRGAILVFDADDRHVASFGFSGARPTGIAVHDRELFVGDFESQQILVVDRHTGQELRRIGERGDEDGRFVWPLGVDVDRSGNVYVADALRCRVQKFSRSGELLQSFGETGDALGSFVRPKLMAVDSDGIMYVVDAAFQNVQMFDEQARLLMFFGGAGEHPGAMLLPVGVSINEGDLELFADRIHPAFKAERLILVTNQFGPNRVSVYAMGRLREGRTPQDVVSAAARIPTSPGGAPDAGAVPRADMDELLRDAPSATGQGSEYTLPEDLPVHLLKPMPAPEPERP